MAHRAVRGLKAASVAAALLLGAASAQADVTIERTMKTGGFGGFGAGETTSVEKISGLRKRAVTTMKMTGIAGRMAGDLGGDEITDIAGDVVWRLDHKKKTYTESKITPPQQPQEAAGGKPERGEKPEKPTVRVVRNEVDVKETGEKKRIGEYDCAHYVITWVLETEDLETKERSESTMITDLWTTPENDETRVLFKQEREFTQAWLKKIGWDMTDQETGRFGLAMVAGMIGGDDASLKKGAKEVAEKMQKVKGYPIGTGVKWLLTSSGDVSGPGQAEPAETKDFAKALGGLMAALNKKGAKTGSGGAAAGGPQPVFDTYTEIRKITTFSIADGEFLPPAGYKKVGQ